MKHLFISLFLLWTAVATFTGCDSGAKPTDQNAANHKSTFDVVATSYPLFVFASELSRDIEAIQVTYPITADSDPANWNPDAAAVKKMQNADLVLINGGNYSQWLQTTSLDESTILNTSEAISDQFILLTDSFVHQHGPEGTGAGAEVVTAVWLDLSMAKKQAKAIYNRLREMAPQSKEKLDANWKSVSEKMTVADQRFAELGKSIGKADIMTATPQLAYFARRYQIKLEPVKIQLDRKLTAEEATSLKETLAEKPSSVILWHREPSQPIQQQLSDQFGLSSVTIDLGDLPDTASDNNPIDANLENWLQRLERNFKKLNLP